MMRPPLALLLLTSAIGTLVYGQGSTPLLDKEDAWLLIMNTPDVIELEAREGCPQLFFTAVGTDRMWIQVRNACPESGNGMIGNYTVDLRDGEIWYGVDPIKFIDSERLRRLRKVLLSRQQLLRRCPPDN